MTPVARVYALRDLLLGIYDEAQAYEWLHSPQPLLGGDVPISLVGTEAGYQRALTVVSQLLDGAHT